MPKTSGSQKVSKCILNLLNILFSTISSMHPDWYHIFLHGLGITFSFVQNKNSSKVDIVEEIGDLNLCSPEGSWPIMILLALNENSLRTHIFHNL